VHQVEYRFSQVHELVQRVQFGADW
jgi:hypothetical protein